jgi:hypothetical protein
MVVRQSKRTETSRARPQSEERAAEVSAGYKAEVVAWYLSSGKSLAEVAASLNLPESTFRDWVWHTSLDDNPERPAQPAWVDGDANEAKMAEALAQADAAAAAVASARADAVVAREETRAAYAAAVEAIVRAEVRAAEAVARAEAAAREEIAAAYAAAVEAMVRSEVRASEMVARAETAAAGAVAEAEALAQSEAVSRLEAEVAAREEVATTYASAMEAVLRAETLAVEALAQGPAEALEVAPVAKPFRAPARPADRTEDEAAARAEIAQLMSRLAPVELWVHATGRTIEEATAGALEQLGVNEPEAEIEVLSNRSRWLPGRIQIRARVRVSEAARR